MAVISGRVRRLGRSRWSPVLATTFVLSLVLTACGFNVQTNLPYTPADGLNLEVGTVQVRNLMILSKAPTEGFLSTSMSSSAEDALVGVTGTVIKPDGSAGGELTATIPAPVPLAGDGTAVVLTDNPAFITLKADDLQAGLTADLTLQFSKAGQTTLRIPILDGNHPYYATVSPSATPSS